MKNFQIALLFLTALLIPSCTSQPDSYFNKGVSEKLAKYRKSSISEISYLMRLKIPEKPQDKIEGSIEIHFHLNDLTKPLVIDFNTDKKNITSVSKDEFQFINNHIVIPEKHLTKGKNEIKIDFTAGESSLNRNEEFLYSLFVPDRASFAFPCFDQPNLKARYELKLTVPESWTAVSNGATLVEKKENGKKYFEFAETEFLSTYLFSFAAGKFNVIEKEISGYKMRMFHRETDPEKIKNNTDEIFNLHAKALTWLEDYTQIKYPFGKFDFVVIPSFQYSGMEHPGAILYRGSKLFLDKNPTETQLLSRASLISHETAHIWFGDYVTMDWFDDVWLKEVFANFMAAKIANPTFPDVNHKLRFLMAHFPGAYSIDRTKGANPVKQKLDNLKFAGTLYGAIIYQKSPIVMQQLENIIGEEKFRIGIREYLNKFKFGNADWTDLVSIFNKFTDENLEQWSDVWINKPGRPEISFSYKLQENKISDFIIIQEDPSKENKIWKQPLSVLYSKNGKTEIFETYLNNKTISIPDMNGFEKPDYILVNSGGLEYGNFILDTDSKKYLLSNVSKIKDDALRGIIWLTLYDNLLNGQIDDLSYANNLFEAIKQEKNQQNLNLMTGQLKNVFWNLLDKEDQSSLSDVIEKELVRLLNNDALPSFKSIYFNTYKDLAFNEKALSNLYKLWCEDLKFKNLNLSQKDKIDLSFEIAVRNHPESAKILSDQLENITNKDVKNKFLFIMPFVSEIEKVRDDIFDSLKDVKRRSHEPWVIQALYYLHHPKRRDYSVKYLKESLGLVEEIQKTGDIFFPKRWLDSTFKFHNSVEAKQIVEKFLNADPDYDERLKNKILQSTDMLFRTAK